MPPPVRIIRILLFAVAGLAALLTAAAVAVLGMTSDALIEVLWLAPPGALGLLLALRTPAGGPLVFRGILGLEVCYILLALVRLAGGDERGLGNLALPLVILALLAHPLARSHFRAS